MDRINITSLYGAKSREGLVQIEMGGQIGQLSVSEAINHARRILEAANAAATDAILARFLMEKLGQPIEVVSAVLAEFRSWRLDNQPC